MECPILVNDRYRLIVTRTDTPSNTAVIGSTSNFLQLFQMVVSQYLTSSGGYANSSSVIT
ncbi:MAG: hypothetical protein KDD45_07910 [Bdellovibrionales bacterium]|nr:hypothetical protein [Bdellovibrionales bacterium]